jgi:hypothetical protein
MSGLVQKVAQVGVRQAARAETTAGLPGDNSHVILSFP